ncbi:MAG TPA: response regulator transcription factor [Candidatus Acidoferrum sp.]|nr:response regulator transcription factor [Candidatus Acidoferrum sp.]
MSDAARPSQVSLQKSFRNTATAGSSQTTKVTKRSELQINGRAECRAEGARIALAVENRLLREALARMLAKRGGFEVVVLEQKEVAGERPHDLFIPEDELVLLLASRGQLQEDLLVIRRMRSTAPEVKVILMGGSGDELEFLQCVRAGISGYLLRDASAEDILEGVKGVQQGEAVCPGTCCAALFRLFEREATKFPSASMQRELGLTRREQQLIPLIAEGLTNKEIANHFCLSEQTVKNHLYRMKHKIGAGDRLGIVQLCHQQGFHL